MATPDPLAAKSNRVIFRARTPVIQRPMPVEGKILTTGTTNGWNWATVDAAPGTACPLPPGLTALPPAGTRVVVAYTSLGSPWVIGFTGLSETQLAQIAAGG